MRLFLEHGFGATTIPMIAQASGVSRTSVFRYWGSKSEIVWAEFDRHIERLGSGLEAADQTLPTMTVVREQVVANLARSMSESSSWMSRFVVLDSSPELSGEEALHWQAWAGVIAEYVSRRHRLDAVAPQPQAVAAAVQAVFLTVLRSWRSAPSPSAELLPELDRTLLGLGDVLQRWLDGPVASE
jgi:AcrR family transcriptional regulator